MQDSAIGHCDIDRSHQSQAHSASSAVTFSNSTRLTVSAFNSDDDDEGGITDDAGEGSERKYLTGKAMHPNAPKQDQYGSKVSLNSVSDSTRECTMTCQ